MPEDSLRLMLVTTSIGRGGAENQVFLLARELARRGNDVHVVSLRDAEAYEDELADLGIPFASLGMVRGVADPRAIPRLARRVRAMRAQVVHSHMIHANLLARVARPLAWADVQISTAHSFREGGRSRDLAYRATDPLATLTTNVCPACVERFVRIGAVPRRKIRYMPNGLDTDGFRVEVDEARRLRNELGARDRFLWLAVGRLDEAKDYPSMLRAVRHVLDRHPGVMLAVAGVAPDEDEGLEALRRTLNLGDDRVRFLGMRSDVVDLMHAADGYLMSSAWEGLPMVLLEAAAAELPIVATDVGGNREIVRPEATGLLTPAGDPEALGEAMTRVMDLPDDRRREWGREARRHVDARFRIDHIAERWEVLYRELLGTPIPASVA